MNDKPQSLKLDQLKQECRSIRTMTRNKLPPVDDFTKAAVAFLEQDISDPALEAASQQTPDIYILRANQIGVELFKRQAYNYATVVFGELLARAENFVKQTGKVRHLGALKVNLGVTLIQMQNYDAGISIILEAATQDDVRTCSISPVTSNALKLLRSFVLNEVASYIALMCDQPFKIATGFPLSPESVLTMVNHSDPLGEAALVSLIPLMQHPEWQKRASTQYGRVRIMDGLRWLSAMLENMVRSIGKTSLDTTTKSQFAASTRITLWPALTIFMDGKASWWVNAQNIVNQGKTRIDHTDSDADVVTKYQALLSLPESIRDELLAKTFLLAYTTRNLSAHYIELPAPVINQVIGDLVKYQLLAQLLFFDWAFNQGHFTTLAAPSVWPK